MWATVSLWWPMDEVLHSQPGEQRRGLQTSRGPALGCGGSAAEETDVSSGEGCRRLAQGRSLSPEVKTWLACCPAGTCLWVLGACPSEPTPPALKPDLKARLSPLQEAWLAPHRLSPSR